MKEIVIVGGGPGGVAFAQAAAKELSSYTDADEAVRITLIEKNEFHFHVYGSLRGIVDESIIPKLFVPYDNAVQGYDHFVMKTGSTVTAIDYSSNTVTYNSNSFITYDYLVLATGSSYPSIKPSSGISYTPKAMGDSIRETGTKIKESNRILVIGGGACGTEMAGELKVAYPDKTIMLIDKNTELLADQNLPKMRAPMKKALEDLGVELILGETLVGEKFSEHQFGFKELTTDSGSKIESDAQLICAGMKPNTSLMTDPLCLNERSSIKVKYTMQVDNPKYENVFVLGDASDHPSPKMGYCAEKQAAHLAESLIPYIMSGSALKPFDGPDTEMISIPLGPDGGLSQFPMCGGFVVGDFMTRMIKSQDLMVGMSWGNLNAKMPN